ncbi:hypothetical protein Vadar_019140 [Vaccinium darrowii]|uniref:Uncharacterized protein n=1 Tax=Vaccinium darrowii TaxID=229202 RepID=A0ACB7Y9A1_9ERIC|nr:hypothetical protein Vadar_019140 [Vaccinium darrowii]
MMMQPLPTVKNVYSLLCEEEKQRGLVEHKSIDQTHAMNVKTHPHFKQQGADTQRHTDPRPRTSSSSKSQGSRKPLLCTYCDGTTHTVERCYYLTGFPIGHKLHGKDVKPPNRNRAIAANQTRTEPSHVSTKPAHPSDPSIQFTSEELSQIKAVSRNGKNPPCANYAEPINSSPDPSLNLHPPTTSPISPSQFSYDNSSLSPDIFSSPFHLPSPPISSPNPTPPAPVLRHSIGYADHQCSYVTFIVAKLVHLLAFQLQARHPLLGKVHDIL